MIKVKLLADSDDVLGRLVAATTGGDFTDEMRTIAEAMRTEALGNFDRQVDPWGAPWAPLKPATIERRLKSRKKTAALFKTKKRGSSAGRGLALAGHLASAKILQDRGALRRGLTAHSTSRTAVAGVTGAATTYAPHVLFGNKDGTLPARAFLPARYVGGRGKIDMPPEMRQLVVDTMKDGILRKLGMRG